MNTTWLANFSWDVNVVYYNKKKITVPKGREDTPISRLIDLWLACICYIKEGAKYLHALMRLEYWIIILRATLGKTFDQQ